jgi:hypothetical protein
MMSGVSVVLQPTETETMPLMLDEAHAQQSTVLQSTVHWVHDSSTAPDTAADQAMTNKPATSQ